MAAKPKSTSSARRKARAASAERADKSLDQFRSALDRSLTLSRERIEEVMDDAVKRGRMTRSDANEMVTKLVDRGRKQSEDLLKEIESHLKQLRGEITTRAERTIDRAQEVIGKASGRSAKPKRAGKKAVAAARKATGARKAGGSRKAGGGRKAPAKRAGSTRAKSAGAAKSGANPIANYASLGAADVRKRLTRLSATDLRKVRAAEQKGKNRKTVLADIDKRLNAG